MKTEKTAREGSAGGRAPVSGGRLAAGLGLLLALVLAPSATAQTDVQTIGGGPRVLGGPANGYWDGEPIQDSQFNFPAGITVTPSSDLLIADRDNGRIRLLSFSANRVFTDLIGLNMPVDVTLDGATNMYVLNQGDGTVFKYNLFGNRANPTITGLVNPTAFALDLTTNLYVTELGGAVKKITPAGVVTTLRTDLNQPQGIEVMNNGLLAVSDTGNHAIRLINSTNGSMTLLTGGNGPGFTDGFAFEAKLNSPQGLAKSGSGLLVVADTGNNRVRLVTTNGIVTTIYGTNSTAWASDYPGWEDGDPTVAESRAPVGVAVAPGGTVYVTEDYYHLIRQVTGSPVSGNGGNGNGGNGGTNGNGTNIVVGLPVLSPKSGYYPMGQLVTVTTTNQAVYYTLDGTEPTTNSIPLALTGGVGTILWQDNLRDLTSLRLKAYDSTNASATASGVNSDVTQIGVSRDVVAGIGSTVVVPVVVNTRTNDQIRSLQFRVEITPNGAAPGISDQFRALTLTTNDFIPVVVSSDTASGNALFNYYQYASGATRGLAIAYISTNANISIKNYGTVAMLAIPVPGAAQIGDSYNLRVLAVTATSDAQQTPVSVTPMATTKIVVGKVSYLVGDSAISRWYNAEQFGELGPGAFGFGDGQLQNNDVNNAFVASFGLRSPFPFSDLFNAMDVYPEDVPGTAGGDGQIRYLDWQVLLARSLGLDADNWRRTWSPGGVLLPSPTVLPGFPDRTGQKMISRAGEIWSPQARLHAVTVQNAPIGTVEVPIEVTVKDGESLSGLQFRAVVTADGNSQPLEGGVQFIPALGYPSPLSVGGLPPNQVGVAWSLYSNPFQPALTGTQQIGKLRFVIPQYARSSHSYTVHFANADGSPMPIQNYTFETVPGTVWVLAPALRPVETV
ncbi:MAG TPA: chitobiase/beta-hexosaminidase C-terminal domain-containing protein, partial [Verrucomicrobiae bacterium]|nr:chitobiase/beta-hexosaminidase C-terminal domain-containing protein [Verrucomicrobiae bacterium]